MKRNQVIIATGIGALTAVAVGYFGVHYLGRNTMYGISAGMFGLGAGGCIGQTVMDKKKQQRVVIEEEF